MSDTQNFNYCSLPEMPQREFSPNVVPDRARLILQNEKKWVNGTVLHYYFFDEPTDGQNVILFDGRTEWRTWTAPKKTKDVVREAFDIWKQAGIGLEFKEVDNREEAEIRIGFQQGDGAWSYVGRDILLQGKDKRTMNLGWDITQPGEIDTAIHEIGHTLGFLHEHQNPIAGIVWDEEAVYTALAKPPNSWPREVTYHNIIRKVDPDSIQGSSWDPDSIMHYPFSAGLIIEPAQYRSGVRPAPGLSARDKEWVRQFYPPMGLSDYQLLEPFKSVMLDIQECEQRNFQIKPDETRYYNIQTFGPSDVVMVLFEESEGEMAYRSGEDDSGEEFNSKIRFKLIKGRNYVLRIRLYYSDSPSQVAVMYW